MPRLSKEAQEARDTLILEWTDKTYEAMEGFGKENGNFIQRADLFGMLDGFPENLYAKIMGILQEQNKISKAGAERGKGAGWSVESLPSPIQATLTAPKIKKKAEPQTVTIKVAGEYPYFARAVLLGRAGVDEVIIIKDELEADYIANDISTSGKNIVQWYRKWSLKKEASHEQ